MKSASGITFYADFGYNITNYPGAYYGPGCQDGVEFTDCTDNTGPDVIKPTNGSKSLDGRIFASIKRNPKYALPIPNGNYDVHLLAMEDEYDTPSRLGDILIEGVKVGTVNTWVLAGRKMRTAIKYTFRNQAVVDGLLNIETANAAYSYLPPTISAILVTAPGWIDTYVPPPPPSIDWTIVPGPAKYDVGPLLF